MIRGGLALKDGNACTQRCNLFAPLSPSAPRLDALRPEARRRLSVLPSNARSFFPQKKKDGNPLRRGGRLKSPSPKCFNRTHFLSCSFKPSSPQPPSSSCEFASAFHFVRFRRPGPSAGVVGLNDCNGGGPRACLVSQRAPSDGLTYGRDRRGHFTRRVREREGGGWLFVLFRKTASVFTTGFRVFIPYYLVFPKSSAGRCKDRETGGVEFPCVTPTLDRLLQFRF